MYRMKNKQISITLFFFYNYDLQSQLPTYLKFVHKKIKLNTD